jgi:perosamine synthetase
LARRISLAEPEISEQDIMQVTRALRSGWVSGSGRYVGEFEERFAEWCGAKYGVATSSGTAALHLALVTLRVRPSDEVIIPAFSMGAIPFAASYVGARIVLVDSDDSTWNMNPALVEEKITKRTKAIIAMHTYGHPVDLGPIREVGKKRHIFVVEDAAEAHGAEYKGKKVGSLGDVGCFSFYANKIITTGEGGMLITSNRLLAERARSLRNMAFKGDPLRRFEHASVAFNYRLTNIQAALGLSQLRRANRFIKERRMRAQRYNELLDSIEGVTIPPQMNWAKNVYWMYSILIDEKTYGLRRDSLLRKLEQHGIETRPFFVPVHMQPAFKGYFGKKAYPCAERLATTGLNLPSGNTLTTKQVERVAHTVISLGKN